MADLLATVDDLAQDLREELDRLAQSAVEEVEVVGAVSFEQADEHAAVEGAADVTEPGKYREIVVAETNRIVADLSEPTSLASIAAILQGTFGTSIRPDWVGYKSFKALLIAAVPGVNVATVGPGYVIPPGSVPNQGWPAPLLDQLP